MCASSYYPTDLSDEQWQLIEWLLPEQTWRPGGRGRPPGDLRQVMNGILYLNKTGCQWRMIPREYGNWSTLYGYFKRWRQAGG
jgi:putative transposase